MPNAHHAVLAGQYIALLALLERRGLDVPGAPSEDEVSSQLGAEPSEQRDRFFTELNRWTRVVRDVLRTPLD